MRVFHCDQCGAVVAFDAMRCPGCGDALGYLSDELTMRTLASNEDSADLDVVGDVVGDGAMWRCLNAAWGCNWMIPVGTAAPWCRSCSLTRGRSGEQRTIAMTAWMAAEAAKRRLNHQLDGAVLHGELHRQLCLVVDGLIAPLGTPSRPSSSPPGRAASTGRRQRFHPRGLVPRDLARLQHRRRGMHFGAVARLAT